MRDKIIGALGAGPMEDGDLELCCAGRIGGAPFHYAVEDLRREGLIVNDHGAWSLAEDALALLDLARLCG